MIDFSLGQYYVHPVQGVVRLMAAVPEGPAATPFYVFENPFAQMTSRVSLSADASQSAGLRPLATPAEIKKVCQTLRQQKRGLPRVTNTRSFCIEAWRRRIQYGTAEECARVLRDLRRDKSEPVRGSREKTIFVEALLRLAPEMALVQGISLDDAKKIIRDHLDAPREGTAPADEQPTTARVAEPAQRSVFASGNGIEGRTYPVKEPGRQATTPQRLRPKRNGP